MWSVLVAGIIVAMPLIVTKAAAQNYPWCSNFADGAGTNCGFSTSEQCKITIQGSGGYCSYNTLYKPPLATAPAPHRTGKHRDRKTS